MPELRQSSTSTDGRSRLFAFTRSITDDAGKTHDLYPQEWKHAPAWDNPESRQALRRAARMIHPGGRRYALTNLGVVFTGMIVVIWIVPNYTSHSKLVRTGLYALVVVIAGIVAAAVGYFHVRLQIVRAANLLRRQSLCPACAYDLRSIPINPATGLTTCPECGAAWRLGDSPSPLP